MLQDVTSSTTALAPHDARGSHPLHRTVFRRISLDGTSSSGINDLYADLATMLPPPPPPTLARCSQKCHGAALDAAPMDQGIKCHRQADVQDNKLVNSYQQLVQHCEREDILMECCVSETGSASSPTFTAQIMVEGKPKACASSKTKKEAVRVAAQQTLSQLLRVSEVLGFVSFSPSTPKKSQCSFPLEDSATSSWEKTDAGHGVTMELLEDELVGSCSQMQLLRLLQDHADQDQQQQMLKAQAEQHMQDRAQQQQQQLEQKRLEDQKDALQNHLQKRNTHMDIQKHFNLALPLPLPVSLSLSLSCLLARSVKSGLLCCEYTPLCCDYIPLCCYYTPLCCEYTPLALPASLSCVYVESRARLPFAQ